jgi:hypothetical protein
MTLAVAGIGLVVAACGGTGGLATPSPATPAGTGAATSGPTAAAVTSPASSLTTTSAALACPSGSTVGTALGVTLPAPVGVKGGGGEKLPAGATGISCEYAGAGLNVIIELVDGVSPAFIDKYSGRFPVPFVTVAGVGDQARSFQQALNGGRDNEGVVATKGSTLVDVTATATPATLAQLEALVSQLL